MVLISELSNLCEATDDEPDFYHNGDHLSNTETVAKRRTRNRADSLVIAWDGEGIDLHGKGKPQSYVLFGCSAEPDSPLVIEKPKQSLEYRQMINYICDVGSRYPGAVHIGFGFGYDQNMIISAMPLRWKERLYNGGAIVFYDGPDKRIKYRIKITWKKRLEVSRTCGNNKVTVRIDDISSFFHSSFVGAYSNVVKQFDDNWQVVVEGKKQRGTQTEFSDLRSVRRYWRAEIIALAQLGQEFKSLMVKGGFPLTDWYGPGALANFLRRKAKLNVHEWGAKESNIPHGLHIAAKSAFYGGRFEQFLCGRIKGPVFSIDINSAYPAGFCDIPTLQESGFWCHVTKASADRRTFGVYSIRYRDAERITSRGIPRRSDIPQPLPYRNKDSNISYPSIVDGWYWRPEAQVMMDLYADKSEIVEGWEWIPATNEYPWRDLMQAMFAIRKELKAKGDTTEMAYKLSINSLYGKMAQRVGWNKETHTPPGSHSLAIAGFITSHCRASLMRVMVQIPVGELIAVETDGIYTTKNPDELDLPSGIGKELGQWELDIYDEMLYVQNGVYCARQGDEWVKTKSRGFSFTYVSPQVLGDYLKTLGPYSKWEPLKIAKKVSSFMGIGIAMQLSRNGKGAINPFKVKALHCLWTEQEREITPSGKGKRVHARAYCYACANGHTAYESAHVLVSNHGTIPTAFRHVLSYGKSPAPEWNPQSAVYRLPWETDELERWRIQAQNEEERIEYEISIQHEMS